MTSNPSSIEVRSVSKSYGTTKAVSDVTLTVRAGEVLGLLGPNGSGKSTLMKMVLGLLKLDSGRISVLGYDVGRQTLNVKRLVGYVPESPRLYEFLTGVEYLDFVADAHRLDLHTKRERIKEFLAALDLEGKQDELINGYSQGMKQKVAIISSLLHRPRILILDEPLNGLDPRSARIVKDLVHRLRGEGVSTIFSTHVLEIADAMCDRIAIMYNGEVLAEGSAQELKTKAGSAGSTLEDVFLKLTGTGDIRDVVEALAK